MKKASELTGVELDYCVAKAQGYERARLNLKGKYGNRTVYVDHVDVVGVGLYKPSSSWAQGGPIIEREKIELKTHHDQGWGARCNSRRGGATRVVYGYGNTPLIAAMRCYVASVYGDTVPS